MALPMSKSLVSCSGEYAHRWRNTRGVRHIALFCSGSFIYFLGKILALIGIRGSKHIHIFPIFHAMLSVIYITLCLCLRYLQPFPLFQATNISLCYDRQTSIKTHRNTQGLLSMFVTQFPTHHEHAHVTTNDASCTLSIPRLHVRHWRD